MTHDERIDRYFSGEMDDLERQVFDKEVMNNPKLAEAMAEYQSMITGIKSYGLQEKVRQMMSTTPVEVKESQQTTHKKPWRYLYFIIAAVVLAASFWFVTTRDAASPEEQLYMAYYYPEPGLPTAMDSNSDRAFNQAMSDYKTGDYESALRQLSAIYNDSGADDRLAFYTAMCQQATGDLKEARMSLEYIENSSEFYPRTLWYLALVELKAGQEARSKELLQILIKIPNTIYTERAQNLLNEINQLESK